MQHAYLWPDTAELRAGRLVIGGCDLNELADTYGTPLYVFDELTLRETIRAYRSVFSTSYPVGSRVHYASKALLNTAIAQLAAQEDLGLDVVSAAELLVAQRADMPMERIHVHGNAKTDQELQRAMEWGVGAIVIDNLDEIDRLARLSAGRDAPQAVLLRIAPNIDAHTHAHIATGGSDSKFGLPLDSVDTAAERVLAAPGLRLIGVHAHIGSQLFAPAELSAAVGVLVEQAARIHHRYGVEIAEISPGGGLGVPYTPDTPSADLTRYAHTLAEALLQQCEIHNLKPPHLTVEPGRSIVARAGVALYRVIARKGGQYLHIDGGMADNIRPSLYGARYTALLANRAKDAPGPAIHVAGRYCESGDVLLRDVLLGHAELGDLLAVATSGAYTLSMASNYNLTPRPAVLLVRNGIAQLIQRRETEDDLLARDLLLM